MTIRIPCTLALAAVVALAFTGLWRSEKTLLSSDDGLDTSSKLKTKILASMTRVARLLATQELYNDVSLAGKNSGFQSWRRALSSQKDIAKIKVKIQKELNDPNSPYYKQIKMQIPRQFRSQIPTFTQDLARESTESAIMQIKESMVKAGQWNIGYLQAGNDIVGNPFNFPALKDNAEDLEHACRSACEGRAACHGYTFHPSQGVCYLKTVSSPVKGLDCTENCWHWGRVVGHPQEMSLSLADAEHDLGLHVTDLKVGTGEELVKGDTATVGYIGKLSDGTVFDQGKYVFTFGRGQVIKGYELGLQGMRVGGRRSLVIPADLGYGRAGYGTTIPSDAILHFDVTLLSLSGEPIASGYKSSTTPN